MDTPNPRYICRRKNCILTCSTFSPLECMRALR
jgi:hypothetical protein